MHSVWYLAELCLCLLLSYMTLHHHFCMSAVLPVSIAVIMTLQQQQHRIIESCCDTVYMLYSCGPCATAAASLIDESHSHVMLCAQGSAPEVSGSEACDGYKASVSERHSDTTSDITQSEATAQKAQGRLLTCSPSLRSSAASTDDMLSPTTAQHLTNGFNGGFNNSTKLHSDLHSAFSGSAVTEHADGAEYLAETGRLRSGLGHVVQDAMRAGFSAEPHQRTLSPELGMCIAAADLNECCSQNLSVTDSCARGMCS